MDSSRLRTLISSLSRLQVGLANVGKSTLFQAITKCTLGNPANFPYATIDPEEARVVVPDERYDWLCEHYKVCSRLLRFFAVPGVALWWSWLRL